MTPRLLVLVPLEAGHLARIREHFEVHHAERADLETIVALGPGVRGVWTNGSIGISSAALEALPDVEMVVAQGAGYENIAMDTARRRGLVVSNGAGTNAACVADHAMALLLASVREIPQVDQAARQGGWAELRVSRPALYGKRLGIVGLGQAGSQLAKRAGGFNMTVSYHNRRPAEGVPFGYCPTVHELAGWADFLVLTCPGGPGTRHLVNAPALEALGRSGYLVNVARGSVVDTQALVEALRERRIAGAALDVFDEEPGIPASLKSLPNVVLTPHLAGSAPEVRDDQVELALRNFIAYFAGQPLVNVLS